MVSDKVLIVAYYLIKNKDYIDTEAEEALGLALEAVKAARTIVKDKYEGQKNKYERKCTNKFYQKICLLVYDSLITKFSG